MAAGGGEADPAMLQNELLMELADDPIEFRHFLSRKKLQQQEQRQKQKEEEKSSSSTLMVQPNRSSEATPSYVFHARSLDCDDAEKEEEEEHSALVLAHLRQRRRQRRRSLGNKKPHLSSMPDLHSSWHSAARSMLGAELDTWQQRSKSRWEEEEEIEKKIRFINECQRQFASDEGEEQHQRMYEQFQMNLRRRSRTEECWRTFLRILCGCFGVGSDSDTYY